MPHFCLSFAATLAVALSLCGSAVAQTPSTFAPEPGAWFAPFSQPEPITTDQERRQADEYDGFLGRLVEADCPRSFPFSGTDPWGDAFQTGDDVHPRVVEACLDRQIVLLTPAVAGSLESLYSRLRVVESEVRQAGAPLTDALVGYHGAWLRGRDARCEYEAAQYLGGTGANHAWLSCNAEALKDHHAWVKREIDRSAVR